MEAGERAENLERQAEEAEALAAIYGDDFVREGDGGTVWEIRVPLGDPDEPDERRPSDDAMLTRDGTPAPDCLVARVVPVETYPSRTPPLVEVHPVGALIQHRMDAALAAMDEEHVAADGDVCVFPFVTRLREMARAWRDEDRPSRRPGRDDDAAADADDDDDDDAPGTGRGEDAETGDAEWDPAAIDAELASLAMTMTERGARDGTAGTAGDDDATGADRPGVGAWTDESVRRSIVAGPSFTEKKSTFQGFLLRDVTSLEQVDAMLRALRRDSRIARCSHLMAAWRIALRGDPRDDPDGCVWAQDHDEDGETGAGRGLSHLLRVTQSADVCVVVARWFGGIHLGPARFQLINNCARDMLERCGFVEGKGGGSKGRGKSNNKGG